MKKLVSLVLACLLCLTALPVLAEETAAAPKHVFLFIGDGMSYPPVSGRSRPSGRAGRRRRGAGAPQREVR